MKHITILLFAIFTLLIASNSNAARVAIEHITLDLEKLNVENLGIVIWDQREMVADRSQPESFLGYVRSMTGIAYGHITKSKRSFVEILEEKIQEAYTKNGTNVGMISITPYESHGDLIQKISSSSFDKILVLKLNKLMHDGVTKIEYVVDVETTIYDNNGVELYSNQVTSNTPMGSAGKKNKTIPVHIKAAVESLLNNSSLRSELAKVKSIPSAIAKSDVIIQKDGAEIEGKVIEITETSIKYKSASQLDGPIRNMAIDKVFMVKYGDGTKEVMSKP